MAVLFTFDFGELWQARKPQMRLKVIPSPGSEHATLANAVDWTGGSLASGGDDQHVQRWTSAGQASGQVSNLRPASMKVFS